MEWNVEISWLLDEQRDTEEIADKLISSLSNLFPAVAVSGRAVQVTATLEAESLSTAFTVASATFRRFFEDQEYFGDLVGVHVSRSCDFDATLTEATFPRMVGVAEVAAELGVSRQRVSELSQQVGFPRPVASLAAGPVWLASSIKRFVESWSRKPGRIRRKTHSTA
jgi:hypothetical protein